MNFRIFHLPAAFLALFFPSSTSSSMVIYPSLFAAIHFMLLLFPSTSLVHTNFTDLSALLAFKSCIKYDPYNTLSNWATNASFCSRNGVLCSQRRQRVVSLSLWNVSLSGTIAPEVANMSFLFYLGLPYNSFVGPIPDSPSRLPRLKTLVLAWKQLSGSIPPAIFNMSLLTQLYLEKKNLSGTLPTNYCFHSMLPQIQNLSLSRNRLSGNIPSSLSYCHLLYTLSLSYNRFSGNIPLEFGNLKQLRFLLFGIYNLTGTVSASLGNLTNLLTLEL